MKPMWFGLALAALGGCGSRDGGSNRTGPVGSERHAIVPTPGTGPNARTPLAPTMAAIDPRSSEAALQQVSGFARLLNDRKFDQAYMLLGPNAPPRLDFDRQWAAAEALHVTIGEPGGQEGAAGSIFLSIPLEVDGKWRGKPMSRRATAILRRINDVPGSTDAQRRWHIERIDWSSTG